MENLRNHILDMYGKRLTDTELAKIIRLALEADKEVKAKTEPDYSFETGV